MGLHSAYLSNTKNVKVWVPNATWVRDPLIVDTAHDSFVDENGTPRDQQFQPGIFVRLCLCLS